MLSTSVGRANTRRPVPCRLLLLPNSLVLLHQSDLLLAPLSSPPPPPAPHPTPALPPASLIASQGGGQLPTSPPSVGPGAGTASEDTRRDSRASNTSAVLPSLGNLRHARHLSSSLTSLASNSSQVHALSAAKSSTANATSGKGVCALSPTSPDSTRNGPANPPRSLALLSADGGRRQYCSEGFSSTGRVRHSSAGNVPEAGASGAVRAPRLPINSRAEARLVALLELRHLASIGRYNECSNTTLLVSHSLVLQIIIVI